MFRNLLTTCRHCNEVFPIANTKDEKPNGFGAICPNCDSYNFKRAVSVVAENNKPDVAAQLFEQQFKSLIKNVNTISNGDFNRAREILKPAAQALIHFLEKGEV